MCSGCRKRAESRISSRRAVRPIAKSVREKIAEANEKLLKAKTK